MLPLVLGGGQTDMGVGLDETGVDGAACTIPDARVVRGADLGRRPHCFDATVTQHDGAAVDGNPRPRHDAGANDGMHPWLRVADAGGGCYPRAGCSMGGSGTQQSRQAMGDSHSESPSLRVFGV